MLLASFVIIGQLNVLLTSDLIKKWLERQVYDFSRLPMESSFMGIDITLMRNIITLPIPIVVGILAKRFLKSVDIYNLNLKAGEKIGSNNNYP